MEVGKVSETLETCPAFITLTAKEDFIKFIRHEIFKSNTAFSIRTCDNIQDV